MGKPTVHDIAQEAGVSLATVDRVLNDRPGVRQPTALRVREAIEKLGYVRDVHAANLARGRHYRFAFILPDSKTQFMDALRDAIAEASEAMRIDRADLRIVDVPLGDPDAMVRALDEIIEAGLDGIAIMANETPAVRDMIAHLKECGVAVATLVTDQPNAQRDHFVGIDNVAAGRTAGALMGRYVGQRRGKIMVVVNTTLARDMVQRRQGFDAVLARDFPHLTALPSLEGQDDREITAQVTKQGLADHDDVVGIYLVGAGTRGLTHTLRETPGADRLTVIAHELTEHTRQALETGVIDVVINQNVGHLVRSAARVLRARCDGRSIIESQERIRIEIVLRENLP
ncbi:MAG: LacI family DNA-binding transcriptional regulator [Devosiaceae bacterium]|nr:LacI family DNA-binding transcriptional regulator [Devosiaceae bacterium MH13]